MTSLDAHVEGLTERVARIGQALPILSDTAIRHENMKGVENMNEESETIMESEMEKLKATAKSQPVPSPAPRQRFTVSLFFGVTGEQVNR